MTELEGRYRWLLRAYPRADRQYRADEMLETLLAAADDTRRPSLEAVAFVVGGLRPRTGVTAQRHREIGLPLNSVASPKSVAVGFDHHSVRHSPENSAQLRIEGFADRLAQHHEADHGGDEECAGEEDHMG
ncbi:hypothetical protein [Micromonospora chersina]|uniref:hypothetical protein n=1 Tax=Micromonospora chersina TaxID=47854 RepID=UPI0037158375